MFDVQAALRELVAKEGSDLHLKAGAAPLFRLDGELTGDSAFPVELAAEDTEHALNSILFNDGKLDEFAQENEVDFSFEIEGVARFRINAFRQRGLISLVCRAIPHKILTIEELALPPVITRTGRRGARDHPADRHHRLGKVDDARGHDRPHQPHDEQAHRDDRGPDRVRAPGQALGDQPARSRDGHGLLQARPAQGAAPGPRRDPRRRDARRGDRRGRRSRPRRPVTWCSRRSTPSTRPSRSTACSTSSRPTSTSRPAA